MSTRISTRLLRFRLCTVASLTLLTPLVGCQSEAEKAQEAERKKAGAELRRKAGLGIAEHEKACAVDDAVSCAALATAYQVGEDKEADPAKAQEFFEKACLLGNGSSCIDAADTYLDKGDDDKAKPLLDAGCKADHDDSCTRLVALKQRAHKGAQAGGAGETGGAAEAGDAKEMTEAERLMAEIEAAEDGDG